MELLSQKDIFLIRNFIKDPTDRRSKLDLNSLFWDKIYELVREGAKNGESTTLGLDEYSDLFNYGILDVSLLDDKEKAVLAIKAEDLPIDNEDIYSFVEWLIVQYRKLLNFDKKEHLNKEIEINRQDVIRKEKDLDKLIDEREEFFINSAKSALASRGALTSSAFNSLISRYRKIYALDSTFKNIAITQFNVSHGTFLNSEQKREFVAKKMEYQKGLAIFDSLLTELRDKSKLQQVKGLCENVEALVNDIISTKSKEDKIKIELESLKTEQLSLSPIEIEAKINGVLDYLKDMMILSSKRLRMDPIAVLHGRVSPVTKSKLEVIIKHVEEFDPKVFNNEKVQYMGAPKFVIIPGYGNGLYDWKNNALIIPTMPTKSIEDAVYMAIIEYKLDVDEEKTMINSFNKIENYRGLKSIFALKDRFAKDYSIFMKQETRGYKVLDKVVRNWFAYEIAPSKHEAKIPRKLASNLLKANEWDDLIEKHKEKIALDNASAIDFYNMGVIYTQDEEYDEAIEMYKKCLNLDENFLNGYFNLGIVCIKKLKKPDAVQAFAQYMKRNPQSYWTGVCQEHIMKLR